MKRREFLKTVCIASTTCLLPACKSTIEYAASTFHDNKLRVEKTAFLNSTNITLKHGNKTIGVVQISHNEYVALLMECTHQGCAISHNQSGYVCPCHGARFDQYGAVIKGPAKKALTGYQTTIDDTFVYVHLNELS